ncbi:MAG: AEC family transporter [Burkholderiaceae bacterium]|nr:AEC family transporter [Burkholderiaceae bacterium]
MADPGLLIRIVAILFPLFAIAALGFAVARTLKPDMGDINRLNMDVFIPALVFGAMAGSDFRIGEYLPLAGAALVSIVALGLIGLGVAQALKIAPKTLVPPMMFNNCGNIGLPLAVLAFGNDALAPAVVLFVVSNTLHYSYGAWLLDHRTRLTTLWRSPTIVATVAGLAVSMSGVALWEPLLTAVRMLGQISVPLMLFALGVRLADARIAALGFGLFGAALRPLSGLVVAWLVLLVVPLPPREAALLIVFSALPPAVLNYIFAERYRQEPDKVASMVLVGNVASVLFLPIALAIALR